MGKDRSIAVSDKNLEDSTPSWDSTPITMRGWLRALPEYLEDLDSDFPMFWSMGAVFGSNNALCGPTNRHTVALKYNLVREHTFEAPITIDIFVDGALPPRTRDLTDNDQKKYYPSVYLCRRKDRSLARQITKTITTRSERKKWRERCNNSGLALIPMLMRKCEEIGPGANNVAQTKLVAIVRQGPSRVCS